MDAITNYHVIDPTNVGDLLSAPANYFSFPGYTLERADIRVAKAEDARDKHLILGGGGLLFPRFLDNIAQLLAGSDSGGKQRPKIIAWGVGQQIYGQDKCENQSFDYSQYLEKFDLIGIRDFSSPHDWVPCASCMHPAFDKQREIQHEFVVFSHKKFQLAIDQFPRMTNEVQNFEEVLDFLGSGETVLTSSYHGAYWATLLGRKVLAFPFSSKFYTFKHRPGIYPVKNWSQPAIRLSLFNKVIYQFKYGNKFSCQTYDWQAALKNCTAYPESLSENRSQNQQYYVRVLDLLNS
ncbi:MAG: hypothetical protein Kow00121_33280 [Elainellaceae cyanobacterium]